MTEQPRLVTDGDYAMDTNHRAECPRRFHPQSECTCSYDYVRQMRMAHEIERLRKDRAALMECLGNMLRDGTVAQINVWEAEAQTLLTSLHEGGSE